MMKRGKIPVTEHLEGRSLLSAISYSLTATPGNAAPGQPIVFTFTETNTSDLPATAEVETPDFEVSQNGFALWQSAPAGTPPSITSETLQPGQSVQQSATWDGTYNSDYSGIYGAGASGQAPYTYNAFGNFSVTNLSDSNGASAAFAITNPLTQTVTTDQSVYQLGEPITATYTEVNTASIPVSVWNPAEQLGIDYANGTPVFEQAWPQILTFAPETLNPGQVVTYTQTFNVIPTSGPLTYANLTGSFFAEFGTESGPLVDSVPFQVVAPTKVVSSLSTDQTSINLGQTVNFTFTETNQGTQPAAILVGDTQFQISADGTPIWYSPWQPVIQTSWITLEPGQSYSQTGSWSGETSSGLHLPESIINGQSTTVTITNWLDLNGDTASLQLNVAGAAPALGTTTANAAISAQLRAAQPTYRVGHTVELSLALKNKGTAKVALKRAASLDQVTVLDGTKVVYQADNVRPKSTARIIKPRETTKLAIAWSGRANQSGVGKLTPGTYTIEVMEDGYVGSTTIRLVN